MLHKARQQIGGRHVKRGSALNQSTIRRLYRNMTFSQDLTSENYLLGDPNM